MQNVALGFLITLTDNVRTDISVAFWVQDVLSLRLLPVFLLL